MPRKKILDELKEGAETVKRTAKKVADKAAAEEVEAKKTVRAAGRKAKKVVEEAGKKAEAIAADVKETAEATVAVAKDETKKAKTAAKKSAADKAAAAKLTIEIQSPLGGSITAEEIAAKVPKEAVNLYVRIDENRIYWVGKKGETGSVEIWE